MLASNNLTELSDVDVLGKFPRLEQLVLIDNSVTKKEVGLVIPFRLRRRGIADSFCFVLVLIALSVLGDMALPDRAVLGLPEGQAG